LKAGEKRGRMDVMIKGEFLLHLLTTALFFSLVILFKRWFDFSYWPFLAGGLMGAYLPDLDHLIYVLLLRPHDLTSQRVNHLMRARRFGAALGLLSRTCKQRRELVFHTILFQVSFFIFAFFVVTSTESLLGRGIVLAFLLHLLVEEAQDLISLKNIDKWVSDLPVLLDLNWASLYWVGNLLALLVLGFML